MGLSLRPGVRYTSQREGGVNRGAGEGEKGGEGERGVGWAGTWSSKAGPGVLGAAWMSVDPKVFGSHGEAGLDT